MRALLWIIAIFAFAAGVGMLAGANEGYVMLVLPPWRAQASLNLVVITLIAGFFTVYFLMRLISRTLDLPGRVGAFRSRRQQEKAAKAMREALGALFEGRFPEAVKQARIAHACSAKSPEAALIAARAAHAMADDKRFAEWMEAAGGSEAGRVGQLLTEAELALDDGRFEEAARALSALRKRGVPSGQLATMELAVARALGRWDEVPEAVRQLLTLRRISADEAQVLLRRVHIERLAALVADREAQATYWRGLSKDDLGDAELVAQAVPLLAAAGQGAIARRVVERLLDKQWNGALARVYSQCAGEGEEARDALSRAERWLEQHPDDAGLLYSLGRQCMLAQIWGKAQSYLERSLAKAPAAEVHYALAELMERLERPVEAKAQYREAARLSLACPA